MATSKLVEKPIGWFKPDESNVKMHNDTQIDHLCASIERFGFRDPIGCLPDGSVLEGHGRLEAAKRMRIKKLPALIITGLSGKDVDAYRIAHNQTTLNTGLDNTAVKEEFQRLNVDESDFLSLGYTAEDGAFLLDETPGSGAQDRGERTGSQTEAPVTTLHFGSKDQFERFTNFLTVLRLRYPDRSSIAERLDAFAAEYGTNL
jgi:hypothetical protein